LQWFRWRLLKVVVMILSVLDMRQAVLSVRHQDPLEKREENKCLVQNIWARNQEKPKMSKKTQLFIYMLAA
jgi:hypothetical protein